MMKRIVLSVCAAVAAAVLARAETYTWVGGNGNWEDGTKWSSSQGEGVPGSGDHAVLPAPANMADNYVVTANEAINVASLTVGSDTVGTDCLATFESKTNGIHQIGAGGLVVKAGGKMTHTALSTKAKTFADECYKLNLQVNGNVTIAADGTIDVTSRGFFGTVTLPGSVTANGSHGGTRAVGGCYDSLIAPTNCGSCTVDSSGGTRYSGGGVVRIDAKDVIVVNGSIISSSKAGTGYGSGAGGSVWLTCSDLQGSGTISVQGGDDNYGSTGSGGRLAVWLTKATGFGSWDGEFIAKGGAYQKSPSGFGSGAPGTIYLQPAGGVTSSTVIIDNGNMSRFKDIGHVELSAATASDVLGSLIVTNNGDVRISSGETIKVHGNIDTTGGFSTWTAGALQLVGLDPATIAGSNTFGDFTCTEPGKTIFFGTAANDNFEIATGHMLMLRGVEGTTLDLRPADETLPWKMKVNPDVEVEIFYASVSNSNANAGEYVTAYGSKDLGGNVWWNFTDIVEPGETITWTGAADSDWTNPSNWEPRRAAVKTDVAVVPSSAVTMPVLDKGKILINEIRVESGATLTLKGYDLTVTNKLTVAGTLTALGKEKIFCPKDVDFTGGTFVAGGSSLVLEGTDAQRVNLNEQAFSTITIEKETGSVTFGDGFKASLLDVHGTDALTLAFAADKTVDATRLVLRGERKGNLPTLLLRSSADGTPWKLKSGTAQFIAGVDVKDSDASAGEKVLTDDSSVDSLGNENWDFGEGGIVNAQWIGTSGDFATAANWSTGKVPDENTRVFIRAGDGEERIVTASAAISVHDLILQGEGTGVATFESKTNATHQIGGDLAVNFGGKMTHTALPTTAKTFADECYKLNLQVDGNVTIAVDGTIDVTSRGFKGTVTLPGSVTANGSHGGTRAVGGCYDSLIAPTNCGSCTVDPAGGTTYLGGGVVRIDAKGAIIVNGSIVASSKAGTGYGSGAGGSVWLTCSDLQGDGMISVQGGDDKYGSAGAGGRLAVWLTKATGFDSWDGDLIAKGGATNGKAGFGSAAPGTIYLHPAGDATSSTVIIDNGNMSRFKDIGHVELSAATASDVLGSLIVTNNGDVRISSGETIKVHGNIDTTGGFSTWTAGALQLVGLDPATIAGSNTFGDFTCTEPGKTIFFGTAANDSFEIAAGHKLMLRGVEGTTLDLRPADETLQWKMKVNPDVEVEIFYASVSNSNANAGEYVTAYGSKDLGGNVWWNFTDIVEPGETITWTGVADSDWTNPENWDRKRKVIETDVAVIPSVIDEVPVTTMPVLDKGKVLINEIRVASGATLTLKGYDLTVTNKLTVAGTLTALGKEKIFCPKDVDFTGGTFVAGGSSFVLEGTDAQRVNLNEQAFSTITIEKETGSVTFGDGFKASLLDVHSADALTLAFAAGKTVDAARLVLRGERKDNLPTLLLRSSSDGMPWKLKSGTAQFITGVDVKDSDASAGVWALTDFTSIDSHNNTHWDFGAGGVTNAQWIGTSGDFATAANWSTGKVPGENTRVFIRAGDGETKTVTASEPIFVHDLILQGEGTGLATFESATKETHRISGDLAVNIGGKMTHTALPTTAKTFADECYKLNLQVDGNVTIAADGKIDVTSRGFFGAVTLPGSVTANGSHGGTREAGGCYDSLIAPTNCGSCVVDARGGGRYPGGGVVRIDAKGVIVVNGSIVSSADAGTGYGSGAGGSVWLTGADLQGDGMISVQGGDDNYGSAGAGGRLAVWLTKATGFDSWDGDLIAKGGAWRLGKSGFGSAAPGTIYLQAAGGNVKTATVIVDNDKLDQFGAVVGYAEICTRTGWKNVGKVVVQNKAYVKLVEDLRIRDLDLATADVNLNVGTNVLTITTTDHKDGKGWADELDKLVVKEIDPDTGKTGDVVWKPQGIAIIVR